MTACLGAWHAGSRRGVETNSPAFQRCVMSSTVPIRRELTRVMTVARNCRGLRVPGNQVMQWTMQGDWACRAGPKPRPKTEWCAQGMGQVRVPVLIVGCFLARIRASVNPRDHCRVSQRFVVNAFVQRIPRDRQASGEILGFAPDRKAREGAGSCSGTNKPHPSKFKMSESLAFISVINYH